MTRSKGQIMRVSVDEVRLVSAMRVGVAALLIGHAIVGHAGTSSQPLTLDTQQGIQDGKGGLLLQTAPLSREPIVEPAQPRTPAGQTSNTTIPIYVAPYIGGLASGVSPLGPPQSQSGPQPQRQTPLQPRQP